MDAYWIPGVNNRKTCGRWAFAEFRDVYQRGSDLKAKIESEFNKIIETVAIEKE
jgi:type III restriction enzyme